MPGGVLRTAGDRRFQCWSRGFEISLRLGGVATNEIDTALQIALWKRHSSLGSDCVQAASSERFRSCSRIAVHQGYVPAAERDHSVRIEIRRKTFERGFNRSCAAFPEKFDVAALYLYIQRIGKEGEDPVHSLGGNAPIAQAKVGLGGIVEHNGVARIDGFRVLVSGDRILPTPLPSLDGSDVETNISIARERVTGEVEFTQRRVVIRFPIVIIQPEREMAFAEIWLETQRLRCLGVSFFF